jgi:hypothetical protein
MMGGASGLIYNQSNCFAAKVVQTEMTVNFIMSAKAVLFVKAIKSVNLSLPDRLIRDK